MILFMNAVSFSEVTSYESSDHDHDLSTVGEHKHHAGCGFYMKKHDIIENEKKGSVWQEPKPPQLP